MEYDFESMLSGGAKCIWWEGAIIFKKNIYFKVLVII
jgi:hypothetical protein